MLTKSYNVVSVMSGTSLDGIDILYAEYTYNGQWSYNILNYETLSYSSFWMNRLKLLTQSSKSQIKEIDKDYSKYLASRILEFIEKYDIESIDFVSSHGHTAHHIPNENYTYQLGNQQIVSNILNKKLICDFRVQDVKLGGQGAPLVPVGDKFLFSQYSNCINLGGFANISFDIGSKRIAFDVCPLNIVLNHFISKLGFAYDDKGKIAKSGHVNAKLLQHLNQLDYYHSEPPKSLGLEWVETNILPIIATFDIKIKDILCTFIEHAAYQISKFLTNQNSLTLVTGGGAYNLFLIERITTLSKSRIIIPEPDLIEYKEALIFGFLGILKDRNEINCLKSVTGAKKDHSSGVIFNPKITFSI